MATVQSTAYFLIGATSTGKTAVAQFLAERYGCAVVSADSMLVYRGMDIGTAKPTLAERGAVPYFGLDFVDPCTPFSAGDWLRAVMPAFEQPTRSPIVAGGTGLYIRALLQGLDAPAADPVARKRWEELLEAKGVPGLQQALEARAVGALARLADPLNPRRLIRALEHCDMDGAEGSTTRDRTLATPSGDGATIVGLRLPRPELRRRIRTRVEHMFNSGLADEVRHLRTRFPLWSKTASAAIGYAEAAAWMDGQMSREEAVERMVVRTSQLAKKQETWFRHQTRVAWVDIEPEEPVTTIAGRVATLWEDYGLTQIRAD